MPNKLVGDDEEALAASRYNRRRIESGEAFADAEKKPAAQSMGQPMSTNPFTDLEGLLNDAEKQNDDALRRLESGEPKAPIVAELAKARAARYQRCQLVEAEARRCAARCGLDRQSVERALATAHECLHGLDTWRPRADGADALANVLLRLRPAIEGLREMAAWLEGAASAGAQAPVPAGRPGGEAQTPALATRGKALQSADLPGPLPTMLSAPDLARRLGLNPDRVESALRRFRQDHPDCYNEVDNPRPREPKYLYRTADVLPVLQRLSNGG